MAESCTTCRKSSHCSRLFKKEHFRACNQHKEKVIIKETIDKTSLEKKLATLELAREERDAISQRITYTKGDDFFELNNALIETYTKTIAKINEELHKEYGILPSQAINKEEILAIFEEEAFV